MTDPQERRSLPLALRAERALRDLPLATEARDVDRKFPPIGLDELVRQSGSSRAQLRGHMLRPLQLPGCKLPADRKNKRGLPEYVPSVSCPLNLPRAFRPLPGDRRTPVKGNAARCRVACAANPDQLAAGRGNDHARRRSRRGIFSLGREAFED